MLGADGNVWLVTTAGVDGPPGDETLSPRMAAMENGCGCVAACTGDGVSTSRLMWMLSSLIPELSAVLSVTERSVPESDADPDR